MEIKKIDKQKFIIVKVSGRLDASTAPLYEEKCRSFIVEGHNKMIIDLNDLEYISSAGLRSILSIGKKIKSNNGKYLFCNLQPMVSDVFKISGFNAIFPVFNTLEDAIEEI
ncbi:STAS domain-containing protein [Desulfonauticus submarinus]